MKRPKRLTVWICGITAVLILLAGVLILIPILGYILDNTLASIPVRVTGDVKDPKVDYLPAPMIGLDLLGIMKRTVDAPRSGC